MVEIRYFARSDRDQVTRLANAHIAAVLPGVAIPTAALLGQLEREPSEFVVDPWVVDRRTLVAVERDRIVAAAYLKRYADEGERVSDDFRNAGEIAWLVSWPDRVDAGAALLARCVEEMSGWAVRVQYAGGSLPALGTYGVSDAWPHIGALYRNAGFEASGHVELQLLADTAIIAPPGEPPMPGLRVSRRLATLGTAFVALLGDEQVGLYEVDDEHTRGGSMMLLTDWADECNFSVREDVRRQGVGTWLLRHAAAWLRQGGKRHLLAYVIEGQGSDRAEAYYARHGFRRINRSVRGWSRCPQVE